MQTQCKIVVKFSYFVLLEESDLDILKKNETKILLFSAIVFVKKNKTIQLIHSAPKR